MTATSHQGTAGTPGPTEARGDHHVTRPMAHGDDVAVLFVDLRPAGVLGPCEVYDRMAILGIWGHNSGSIEAHMGVSGLIPGPRMEEIDKGPILQSGL